MLNSWHWTVFTPWRQRDSNPIHKVNPDPSPRKITTRPFWFQGFHQVRARIDIVEPELESASRRNSSRVSNYDRGEPQQRQPAAEKVANEHDFLK